MQRNLVISSGLVALGLSAGWAMPASASTVTYDLIPGSPSEVLVTATISGGIFSNTTLDFNGAASWQLNLTSGSLTLDNGTPALDAFSFGDSSAGPETISAAGHTLGTLSLTNILVQSTRNPDAPLTGSNPYGLNTSNVMDSANYSVTPAGGSTKAGSISNTGTPITGSILTGGTMPLSFAQSDTIQLGSMTFTSAGVTYTVSLKGDTNFDGASPVPLPAGLWLLASGLAVLGFGWKRQRATRARPLSLAVQMLAAASLALAFGAAPRKASAETLTVTGGAGLDGGALCTSGGFFCPTTSDLTFPGSSNPVSGSFTYNSALSQLSFSLTLNEAVTFSGGGVSETFEPGTTFTGNNLSVSAPTGSGGTVSTANVTGGAESLFYVTSSQSSQQQLTNSSLFISSLTCQTVGAAEQCGLILGTGGSNEVPAGPIGSQGYGGVLDFNVNVSPTVVPLPAAAWLLVSGLGGLAGLRRRVPQVTR